MTQINTLDLEELIVPDNLGLHIAEKWLDWSTRRQKKMREWQEVREYIYQTDTSQTQNNVLPWHNKTTTPKLCQIRDNLFANYEASMFPKRNWFKWEGDDEVAEQKTKKDAIESYMKWSVRRSNFRTEMSKLILDYIDYGNCFAMPTWLNNTQEVEAEGQNPPVYKAGYNGPSILRISPEDIVFNPVSVSFRDSPKIVRSFVTLGGLQKEIMKARTEEQRQEAEDLFDYFKDLRHNALTFGGDLIERDARFSMDGFDSYRAYLGSDYIEILTFYGDVYDPENNEFMENHIIKIVDRHKVISKKINPSYLGKPAIRHVGWRVRQDNLWAMGPLDNLIGLQYRIDHLENLKADLMDLVTFPPLKIKGYVDDFEWGPFEKVHVGDDGDVEILAVDSQPLSINLEIEALMTKMEEMAGAPKEAMGFRTPGEKTAFEVQRLENAASRIFQSKIKQFEEVFVEPLLNDMLELARRNMDATTIRVIDEEFNIAAFQQISPSDIAGMGVLRPMAARHFAEKAERVQNLNNFFNSSAGADPAVLQHFSSVKLAQLWADLLDIDHYNIVQENVRISEMLDAQRLANAGEEDVLAEAGTPAGLAEGDFDDDLV